MTPPGNRWPLHAIDAVGVSQYEEGMHVDSPLPTDDHCARVSQRDKRRTRCCRSGESEWRRSPLHVHQREDEAFYVLEGEYTVFVGDEAIAGIPGTWVWGPRDVPHGYQVHSPHGRHLSLTMPAGFEAFFEEVADLATPATDPRTR